MSNTIELFKEDILKFISNNEILIKNNDEDITNVFVEYIKNYEIRYAGNAKEPSVNPALSNITNDDICIAKISQGVRCSRKHKKGNVYCGTHIKRHPAGVFEETVKPIRVKMEKKVDIWVQLIRGINYYIDENNNVYNPEHILLLNKNPSVIYKWKLNDASDYEIIPLEC
jgi:hypothetical protein